MTSPELASLFCQDIATLQKLGLRIVVVHGGGPMINAMLDKVGVVSTWEGGMRVSTPEVVDVASMVLCGSVNKDISSGIGNAGGRALGLSGRDDGLLQCTKLLGGDDGNPVDLGNVGQVHLVNTKLIHELLDAGISPVIAPIGMGCRGSSDEKVVYNINADVAAGRIAGELRAARVYFLTDIAGVLDKEKKLMDRLSVSDVDALIKDETITGGMIPKGTWVVVVSWSSLHTSLTWSSSAQDRFAFEFVCFCIILFLHRYRSTLSFAFILFWRMCPNQLYYPTIINNICTTIHNNAFPRIYRTTKTSDLCHRCREIGSTWCIYYRWTCSTCTPQ